LLGDRPRLLELAATVASSRALSADLDALLGRRAA